MEFSSFFVSPVEDALAAHQQVQINSDITLVHHGLSNLSAAGNEVLDEFEVLV